MKYSLQLRTYNRTFAKPLLTGRGSIFARKGIIIRLEDEIGSIGYGEIAPLEFLGSESFDDVVAFCMKNHCLITDEFIDSIHETLPTCQFGFESAREMITRKEGIFKNEFNVAALLFLGDKPDPLLEKGYRVFKLKIGKGSFEKERDLFLEFFDKLPSNVGIRLDANGSLQKESCCKWLQFLENYPLEFLEQPLSAGNEVWLSNFCRDYKTSIALDESILSIKAFSKLIESQWPGLFVVKPALLGSPNQFRKLRKICANRIIYSSSFETAIGMEAALFLAGEDIENNFALGFGTLEYFNEDGLSEHKKGPTIRPGSLSMETFKRIWELCKPMN